MTAPGNSAILLVLLAAFLACAGYSAGRLHQWHRTGQDRAEAYRDGYDTATRSVFSLAARIIAPRRSGAVRGSARVPPAPATGPPAVPAPGGPAPGRRRSRLASYRDNARRLPGTAPPVPGDPSPGIPEGDTTRLVPVDTPGDTGRHTVPDEVVQAVTHRLRPDRVARARAREAEQHADPPDEETTRLPPVPRPRSS